VCFIHCRNQNEWSRDGDAERCALIRTVKLSIYGLVVVWFERRWWESRRKGRCPV
jgi:hypothetical protein